MRVLRGGTLSARSATSLWSLISRGYEGYNFSGSPTYQQGYGRSRSRPFCFWLEKLAWKANSLVLSAHIPTAVMHQP